MNHILTTTLEHSVYTFLDTQAKNTRKSKKSFIEAALKLYEKNQLRQQIEIGLSERYDEYQSINKDFLEAELISLKM